MNLSKRNHTVVNLLLKLDVSSDAYWLLSLISQIKMCAEGIFYSPPETCVQEGDG